MNYTLFVTSRRKGTKNGRQNETGPGIVKNGTNG